MGHEKEEFLDSHLIKKKLSVIKTEKIKVNLGTEIFGRKALQKIHKELEIFEQLSTE